MRKPDQICRVCQQLPSLSLLGEVCSPECEQRLAETEYYERELEERTATLCEFEEGVYLPLYLRLARVEAQLRVLMVGVRQLSQQEHIKSSLNEHPEVVEWRVAQAAADTFAISLAKRPIRRLRQKGRQLEKELRSIDKRWRSLFDKKEATLKKLSLARGD